MRKILTKFLVVKESIHLSNLKFLAMNSIILINTKKSLMINNDVIRPLKTKWEILIMNQFRAVSYCMMIQC